MNMNRRSMLGRLFCAPIAFVATEPATKPEARSISQLSRVFATELAKLDETFEDAVLAHSRHADPRYMGIALRCVDMRCKILRLCERKTVR